MKYLAGWLAALLAIVAVSCTGATKAEQPPPVAKTPEPVTVKIGVIPGTIADAFTYVAVDNGYFAQEGIKPELIPFDNQAKMIPALAAGQLDVGGGAQGVALFNAIKRDIPIKIVADRGRASPGHGYIALLARKDLVDSGRLKGYADLKGKTIAIPARGISAEIQAYKAAEKGGLTLYDVNVTLLPFPDMNIALANKSIDLATQSEPLVAKAVQDGFAVRWKGIDEVYPDMQISVVIYSPKFATEAKEAAKRYMVAYIKAVRDYVDAFEKSKHRAEVVSILTKHTTVKEPSVYDKMVSQGVNPDGYLNLEGLQRDVDWYVANGEMQNKIDVREMVDYQYVDFALNKLGKYK